MFSITGLEFSFTQAPESMKSGKDQFPSIDEIKLNLIIF